MTTLPVIAKPVNTRKKTQTINLKGKDYATVPARIKEFREANPNGLIETKPDYLNNGHVVFTARILKDKANPNSAEATGHSIGELNGDKAFEKLETIAIGRALAILGYMASGEIASSEEMEKFNQYLVEKIETWVEEAGKIKTLDELKAYYMENKGSGSDFDRIIMERKKQLTPKHENS